VTLNWPVEIWKQLVAIIAVVLLAWSVPLAIFSVIRKRRGKDFKAMWIKYASWFVMIPAFIIPMFLGATWVQLVLLAMSLYAFEEYGRAVGLWKEKNQMWLGRACIVLAYIPVFARSFGTFMSAPAYIIIIIFLFPILRDRYQGMIQRTVLVIFGAIYFGWFLAHLAYLMNVDVGPQLVLAFLLIVITNDAAAYVIGSNFGRHKLAPNISPNKTWEGAIGAMIVAVAVTLGIRFALLGMSVGVAIFVGLALAFFGTCGDLSISLIKRDVQIKDTGSLIPGHGGLLDRLDSILFVAPLFFHFMNAFYISAISI
jgi:phosphatidate cytidylyltransferase